MRIALLGADADMLEIAAEAVRSGRHQVVLAADVAEFSAQLKHETPQLVVAEDWHQVLNGRDIDAVLVATGQSETRIEQVRQLLQAELPMVVAHPLVLSMLDCYELDMIRLEMGCVMVPALSARHQPPVLHLKKAVEADESPLGVVEQITLERCLPTRDRDSVLRAFSRDADLLQFLGGEATKLHALGATGQGNNPYVNLTIQMTCGDGVVCRWSAAPIEWEPGARLTVLGSKGKGTIWMPVGNGTWQLNLQPGAGPPSEAATTLSRGAIVLGQLEAGASGKEIHPDWTDASRCIELAETVDRSLARGRTIDLHREEFSDIGTFKGTMTSIGCGLLLTGVTLVFLAAIVHTIAIEAGFERLANALSIWPYALLAVLGLFLVLQFLVFAGRRPAPPGDSDERPPDSL